MTIYRNGKPWVLKVEKGVPIPTERKKQKDSVFSAAKLMEVGDCLTLPYTRNYPWASNLSRATGFKFTQRKVETEDGPAIRIWRTE
jgi:hypothetical protein